MSGPNGNGNARPPRIVQIACCAIPGDRRTFANVYGLDDQGHVWQWNASDGRFTPFVIKRNGNTSRGRDDRDDSRDGGWSR